MDDFEILKDKIKSNDGIKDQVKSAVKSGWIDTLRSLILAFAEDVFTFFRLRRTGQEITRAVNRLIDWAVKKWK